MITRPKAAAAQSRSTDLRVTITHQTQDRVREAAVILSAQFDMGTVPAWFGGASLVLALLIFGRDRTANDRKYVDLVAVWWEIEYERRMPNDSTRIEDVTVTLFLKNAGNLPVEVTAVEYTLTPSWLVRDLHQWPKRADGSFMEPNDPGFTGVWTVSTAQSSGRNFIQDIRIPPDKIITCGPYPMNIAHLVPDHADQLSPINGVKCKIEHMEVIDNTGRKWEVRPGAARRPIHLHRYRTRLRAFRDKWSTKP
ncbi:hypothetical protein [Streptomyces sp. NPDC015345]|uniref:hypothetical protein n=1 Tax=Streptomyces sp. NPDC015345 TaxID=3364953 RepID=UPI0036FDB589